MPTPLPQPYVPDYGKTIDAFRTGQQDFLAQKKRQLMQEAGGLAAAGNLAGARNKLYSGGEFDEAYKAGGEMRAQSAEARAAQAHARSLDDAQLAKTAKATELLGNIAGAIKTPEDFDKAVSFLSARGYKLNGVTYDMLPMLKSQNVSVQQQLQNEMEDRCLRLQEQEATQRQSNFDQTFRNTLDRQRVQDQLAERDYLAGREDKRLDRQYQDRVFDAGRDDATARQRYQEDQIRLLTERAKAQAAKAGAPKPLTEAQATSRAYLGELESVNKRLEPRQDRVTKKLGYKGSVLTDTGESPLNKHTDQLAASEYTPSLVSSAFLSKKEKQFLQAAEQFISVLLYKRSGAQISSEEFGRNYRIYFPQPGDDAKTRKYKADARKLVLDGLRIQGGYDAPGAAETGGANAETDDSGFKVIDVTD